MWGYRKCEGSRRWRRRRAGREGPEGGSMTALGAGVGYRGVGGFRGKRHGPRTRKRDPRKLKGGTAVLLCLKRQFAGLRYGLYITAQLLRVVGDSSVDSELSFARGDLLWASFGPYLSLPEPLAPLLPLHGGISPLLVVPRDRGLLHPHRLAGKCVSCVARCSFADGTIYSRYSRTAVFKYLLAGANEISRASSSTAADFFCLRPPCRPPRRPVSLRLEEGILRSSRPPYTRNYSIVTTAFPT